MHLIRRHRWKVLALVVFLVGSFAAAAIAVNYSSGGSITQVKVARDTSLTGSSSTIYVDVAGSAQTITVPSPGGLLVARFSAESECRGPVASGCYARILANNIEMAPPSGNDFLFDQVPTAGNDLREAHAMERSARVAAGTYRVVVQRRVNTSSATFFLDDWHLTVERAQ